jgi:hypothetical protein
VRLTDLLDAEVLDREDRKIGVVTDVRLVQDGPLIGEIGAAFRVHGLVIGRTSIGAHMGFERRNVRGPWLLKKLFWLIQGTERYATWSQIRSIESHRVRLTEPADRLPAAEEPA